MEVLIIIALFVGANIAWLYTMRYFTVQFYRAELLRQLLIAAGRDSMNGLDSMWRYNEWRKVSFGQMARTLKPLERFWPDRSFLDPEADGSHLWS